LTNRQKREESPVMLTLTDLKLGLRDLFDKRLADVHKSKAGKFYESALKEQLEAIEALPPALTGGTPLANELDAMDTRHDGFGGAIYFTTEACLRLPDVDPPVAEAARRIRAAFIPALAELGAPYAVEAERAIERKPLLTSMKADLKLFTLAGGGTLFDVAKGFLEAGEKLHELLSDRADALGASRKDAAALRPATIGLLNRFRADLGREIKKEKSLPRDLDHKVFGYFDTLESMHAAAKAPAASGTSTGGAPTDATGGVPPPKP
jgi:hypothetical protein